MAQDIAALSNGSKRVLALFMSRCPINACRFSAVYQHAGNLRVAFAWKTRALARNDTGPLRDTNLLTYAGFLDLGNRIKVVFGDLTVTVYQCAEFKIENSELGGSDNDNSATRLSRCVQGGGRVEFSWRLDFR
ncbi:hypothetical protein KUL25_05165 [Rhodobacteraceae bacterium N5(2021)]|uniref:Uncharacterized protein n=1 Tax=Gymnodinialimonas phycosphaerae TaxID=2841589 RepID=A0A975TYC3_9RHOB|nr:hypothetical protein [Gymnodinialimonas phycosphaerae]MBY4892151.1 hypothetical protein [Gymnodinialimonas phycosphaerae]